MEIQGPLFASRYREYMASPEWRQRKIRFFATTARVCAACETTVDIQVHHHTYERLGVELDADLVAVCASCHRLIHRYQSRTGEDLSIATFEVIAMMNGNPIEPPAPTRIFVPRNQRRATVDESGRIISTRDWRDDSRGLLPSERR